MADTPVPVTEAEASYIRYLHESGVLEEIDPNQIARERGTLFVHCSDGHHFDDFYSHHRATCSHDCDDPMHHPIALNGGALLIPVESPMLWEGNERQYCDMTALRHIRLGMGIKTPKTMVLGAHAPCGMCRTFGIPIEESFPLLFKAKDRVRAMFAEYGIDGVTVIAHFHVFFPDGRRRTYHVHRSQWNSLGMVTQLETA